MGNCCAPQTHIAVDDRPNRKRSHKQPKVEQARHKDLTETSASDFDLTMPLSPDSQIDTLVDFGRLSPNVSVNLSSAPFIHHAPSEGVQYDMMDADSIIPSVNSRGSRRSLISRGRSGTPSSRALQNRLEKARHMQLALSSSAQSFDSRSLYSNSTTNSFRNDDLNSLRFSLSDHPIASSRATNDDVALQKGLVWAEMEQTDQILALAFSRRKPTLHSSLPPPLSLAIGTDDGRVTVTELLDDEAAPTTSIGGNALNSSGSTSSSESSEKRQRQRRLGPSLRINRQGRIRCVDFSPDGRYLAVGGDDCVCALYELDYREIDGTETLVDLILCAEIPRVDRIMTIQFDPASRYLAVGGYDGTAAIVCLEQLIVSSILDIEVEIPRDGLILALDWSPDGRYLALGGSDKFCLIMDARNDWRIVKEIRRPVAIAALEWHPSGRWLAIGANNIAIVERESLHIKREIELRDSARGGSPSKRSQSRVHDLCWSPNGNYLVASGLDRCSMYETKSYNLIYDLRKGSGATRVIWGQQNVLAGVPRRYLVLGGEDRKVAILKAGLEATSTQVGDDMSASSSAASSSYFSARGDWVLKDNTFRDIDESPAKSLIVKNRSYEGTGVVTMIFSQGSKARSSAFFCIATDDGYVTVRSTLDWKVLAQIEFPCLIRAMSFSHGSRFLALGGEDGKVRILATVPLWKVATEVDFETPVAAVAFSKNNEMLAVGCSDGLLAFLNTAKGWQSMGEVELSDSCIVALNWNSRHLAVGREDGTIQIHASGEVLNGNFVQNEAQLVCKTSAHALAFGSNSRFLVVGDGEGMLHVYSAQGGWQLCHEIKAGSSIQAVSWSPTGRYLAFGNAESSFRVVDTIFWTEVEEANELSTFAPSGSLAPKIAFSQDGKRAAYCDMGGGTHIVDTDKWDVKFSLHPSATTELDIVDESSISSREDDGGLLSD